MAEGILRNSASDLFELFSAGSNPKGEVHPLAIEALKEINIDISDHTSDHLDLYLNSGIDTVITVCDNAKEACPVFPNSPKSYHWSFEDPPHAMREGESGIDAFRRIRDQIKLVFEAYVSGYRDAQ
jgi:arsenate reductase